MIYFRYKYSDGVFAGQFQNSGVKMLIPLVVVPDCQEHYENVRDMRIWWMSRQSSVSPSHLT